MLHLKLESVYVSMGLGTMLTACAELQWAEMNTSPVICEKEDRSQYASFDS